LLVDVEVLAALSEGLVEAFSKPKVIEKSWLENLCLPPQIELDGWDFWL